MGEKCADTLKAGDHGSTFGGNPVACAGALSIVNRVDEALMKEVAEKGEFISSVDAPEGSTLDAPYHPTKEGKRFTGWSRSGGDVWNFKKDTVESNLILMAEWEDAKTYTVTFDTDGGSKVEVQYVAEGDKIQVPKNPQKEGQLFDCWLDGKDEWNFERYPVTKNITLKAQWKLIIPIHPTNP